MGSYELDDYKEVGQFSLPLLKEKKKKRTLILILTLK